jgi:hypothetical protein
MLPQSIPDGALVTVPVPVPARVTASAGCAEVKIAVTDELLFKVTAHGVAPLQAPAHPEKVDPAAADAASVTLLPALKLLLHCDPQLMPVGLLVTVPAPLPEF